MRAAYPGKSPHAASAINSHWGVTSSRTIDTSAARLAPISASTSWTSPGTYLTSADEPIDHHRRPGLPVSGGRDAPVNRPTRGPSATQYKRFGRLGFNLSLRLLRCRG